MFDFSQKTAFRNFTLVLGCLFELGCDALMPALPPEEELLDGAVAELTTEQFRQHVIGDVEFGNVFTSANGLGPIFNAASCESCHIGDGKGHGLTTLTRFGRISNGVFDPMLEFGGPQLQNRAIAGYPAEILPPGVTGMSKFLPPAVTGLGYIEAIADSTFLALADPNDINGDGISGTPNYVTAPEYFQALAAHIPLNGKYIGRFGRKAGAINLLHQTVNAYINDMGITSDFHMEDVYNVALGTNTSDVIPDPELPAARVNATVFYMQTLKAPLRRNATAENVISGEKLFTEIGCASCHTPTLKTGNSSIAALSNKTIHPYSDFLLHDMGTELDDGYTEGSATTAEWRTTPLWGLGLTSTTTGGKGLYLHDGRATTIESAIEFHGGESSASRSKYRALTPAQKSQLIEFLESL